jgi:hypothetical protein
MSMKHEKTLFLPPLQVALMRLQRASIAEIFP